MCILVWKKKMKKKEQIFKSIADFSPNNIYFTFIKSCKTLEILQDRYTENHHIIPLSHGGSDTRENIICLSYCNHVEAHRLIFMVTHNLVDAYIYNMMSGQTTESRKLFRQLGAYVSHTKQKNARTGMFSKEFQKNMSQRSLKSEIAQKARKKVGTELGKKRQINRILTSDQKFLLTKDNQEIVCIMNCNTGQDIVRIIALIDPTVNSI